jgi:hypothetical protein
MKGDAYVVGNVIDVKVVGFLCGFFLCLKYKKEFPVTQTGKYL